MREQKDLLMIIERLLSQIKAKQLKSKKAGRHTEFQESLIQGDPI